MTSIFYINGRSLRTVSSFDINVDRILSSNGFKKERRGKHLLYCKEDLEIKAIENYRPKERQPSSCIFIIFGEDEVKCKSFGKDLENYFLVRGYKTLCNIIN